MEPNENELVDLALRKADYIVDTVRRISAGTRIKAPPHGFGMGEGDDTVNGYTWAYVETFAAHWADKTTSQGHFGYIIGLMYTQAGMSLELQDRTGRGGYAHVLDTTGRLECTFRIYSLTTDAQLWCP